MKSAEEESWFVEENEQGIRLDKLLADKYENRYSRTYFQNLIAEKLVLLNGAPVKKREKLQAGDQIEIQFACPKEIDLKAENIPLDILYEDQDLIVVNKSKDLVIHPAPGNWSHTFVNALLYHCQNQNWNKSSLESLRPGIVHRLDKDTTGVLLAAKNLEAQQKLTEYFAARKVYKEYLAITLGNPGKVSIDKAIGRHPKLRQKMAILESGGKEALSYVETLKSSKNLSLARVIIATGRTHQIRLHLSHLKTPVLGDSVYGNLSANQKYKTERPYLHASCLRIQHPMKKVEMEFLAPLPLDMQEMIQKFDK